MKKSNQPDISIVIPAYREEKRIGNTLDKLSDFLETDSTLKDKTVEVIVVSADAPDKTHEIVREKINQFQDLKLLQPGARVGKGRDVKHGMLKASGRAVIFMDADLATPLSYLPKFYNAWENGADIVIATRNLYKHHPSVARRLLSNMGNLLFRVVGGVWVEDSQCGFKLFSQSATELCFSKLTIMGWGFDMEILAIAGVNKLQIVSHRVDDWVSVPGGVFVDSIFKNSVKSVAELGYIFMNRLRGRYKAEA